MSPDGGEDGLNRLFQYFESANDAEPWREVGPLLETVWTHPAKR